MNMKYYFKREKEEETLFCIDAENDIHAVYLATKETISLDDYLKTVYRSEENDCGEITLVPIFTV